MQRAGANSDKAADAPHKTLHATFKPRTERKERDAAGRPRTTAKSGARRANTRRIVKRSTVQGGRGVGDGYAASKFSFFKGRPGRWRGRMCFSSFSYRRRAFLIALYPTRWESIISRGDSCRDSLRAVSYMLTIYPCLGCPHFLSFVSIFPIEFSGVILVDFLLGIVGNHPLR